MNENHGRPRPFMSSENKRVFEHDCGRRVQGRNRNSDEGTEKQRVLTSSIHRLTEPRPRPRPRPSTAALTETT